MIHTSPLVMLWNATNMNIIVNRPRPRITHRGQNKAVGGSKRDLCINGTIYTIDNGTATNASM